MIPPASKHSCRSTFSIADSRKISANAAPKITTAPAMLPRIGSRRRHTGAATRTPIGSGANAITAIHVQLRSFMLLPLLRARAEQDALDAAVIALVARVLV